MTNEHNVAKLSDSTKENIAHPCGTAWNFDLSRPEDARFANNTNTQLPKEFGSPVEFYDSRQQNTGNTSDRLKQFLEVELLRGLDPKSFSELMKPIEDALLNYVEHHPNPWEQTKHHGRNDDNTYHTHHDCWDYPKDNNKDQNKDDTKNDTNNKSKDNSKDDSSDKNKDNSNNDKNKDNSKNDTKDTSKDNNKDDTKDNKNTHKDGGKDNTTDDTNNRPNDNVHNGDRVVHVKNGHELESLKIEKGMTVKLDPGGHYAIHKSLQLPEGASIVGDKNNPPSIDFVGPTVTDRGRNYFPPCIQVNGAHATVDGLKVECSSAQYGTRGGANGIIAMEGADYLTVKNCTAGKINNFVHLNGADNVTVDNCNVDKVNSYFVWNEYGSNNNTIKNSRCDDSAQEWTIRSYGDNLTVEDSHIGNKNPVNGPFKGALALYNGSATVKDCIIDSGVRIGPLNEFVHGQQYIDPEHPNRLRDDLTPDERKKAEILHDSIDVRVTGSKITGWVSLNQNSNSYFEDNDINRSTAANGSWVAFTETKKAYAGFRTPAEGVFVNNRFSGPVGRPLYDPWNTPVHLGKGNTFNGRDVQPSDK